MGTHREDDRSNDALESLDYSILPVFLSGDWCQRPEQPVAFAVKPAVKYNVVAGPKDREKFTTPDYLQQLLR